MCMDACVTMRDPGVCAAGDDGLKGMRQEANIPLQAACASGRPARVSAPRDLRSICRARTVLGAVTASLAMVFSSLPGTAMAADAEHGGLLYQTRCKACHEDSVHNRNSRKAESYAALRAQVLRWSAEAGGVWTADEIDDVARYLNERYYRFPCPQVMCKANQALITR
jgi:mono/diheme cytochrome c family protein